MRLVGWTLFLGGLGLLLSWPSNAAGVASVFVCAAGLAFLEAASAPYASFDDLGRGRLGE